MEEILELLNQIIQNVGGNPQPVMESLKIILALLDHVLVEEDARSLTGMILVEDT